MAEISRGPESPQTNATYTVKRGDTFSQIAKNEGISMAELRKINPQIAKIGMIKAGEKINVPEKGKAQVDTTQVAAVQAGQKAAAQIVETSQPLTSEAQASLNQLNTLLPGGDTTKEKALEKDKNKQISEIFGRIAKHLKIDMPTGEIVLNEKGKITINGAPTDILSQIHSFKVGHERGQTIDGKAFTGITPNPQLAQECKTLYALLNNQTGSPEEKPLIRYDKYASIKDLSDILSGKIGYGVKSPIDDTIMKFSRENLKTGFFGGIEELDGSKKQEAIDYLESYAGKKDPKEIVNVAIQKMNQGGDMQWAIAKLMIACGGDYEKVGREFYNRQNKGDLQGNTFRAA